MADCVTIIGVALKSISFFLFCFVLLLLSLQLGVKLASSLKDVLERHPLVVTINNNYNNNNNGDDDDDDTATQLVLQLFAMLLALAVSRSFSSLYIIHMFVIFFTF
jgi:hypothetical protein